MKIEEPKAGRPSPEIQPADFSHAAKLDNPWALLLAFLGGLALVWIWSWNYNLLGDFYDYSILASSAGYLRHGLTPYRDFATSLQSLTIYLGYGCELLFGPRYLALAYGNLIWGLAAYAATLLTLKNRLPLLLCVLCGMALTVATFFQHGILWYNSIAMLLLALIVWVGANISREGDLNKGRFAILCLVLFLSSMTKLNFHLLGVAMASVFVARSFFKSNSAERTQLIWALPLMLLCEFVLGPMVEVLANKTTFHEFVQNVLLTPSGRLRDSLPQLLDPGLYFNKAHDFYPDNYSAGIYLTGLVLYGLCAFAMAGRPDKSAVSSRLLVPILLVVQFLFSLLLTASNHEIQVLTASYLVVGLVAVYILQANAMTDMQNRCFKFAIALLSGIFLVAGGASSFKHSRLRFLESESDVSHAIVSPGMAGYFQGVRFTQTAWSRLSRITNFMEKNHLTQTPEKVYWGPGLEMLNRVYGICSKGRFPLWYHLNVSVNDSDGPRIVGALEKGQYEWVVASVYYTKELPAGVRGYLHDHFELADREDMGKDLVILHREH